MVHHTDNYLKVTIVLVFMINKKNFEQMRSVMDGFDKTREDVIKIARIILKNSKKSIFACHRGDLKNARILLDESKVKIKEMEKLISADHDLMISIHNEALEEFVEAECFYNFLKNKKIPTCKELNVSVETYLQGLCDLTGELTRKAVNEVIEGNVDGVLEIKKLISDLYEELMQFDFRNSPLRRKYDAIKYSLEKLEDLSLKIKLK